jgi:hypothetical protein
MTRTRIAGLVLLAIMVAHVLLEPEGLWVLAFSCDIAAMVTAIGLVGGWHRAVAVAFLFEVAVGLPAFILGLFTTLEMNETNILMHVLPPVLGGVVVAREGLPRRCWLMAWVGYTVSFVVACAVAPREYNVNFAAEVWSPFRGVLTLTQFQAALIAIALGWLPGWELVIRRGFRVKTMR